MNSFDKFIFMIHVASCFYMTGVILVIQLIHYPCFAFIEKNSFTEFHSRHTSALGMIAGPGMLIELASAAWIARFENRILLFNLFTVLLLWGITFLIAVPIHNKLSQDFEVQVWLRLVKMNWLRTTLWGCRSLVFLVWALWVTIQ